MLEHKGNGGGASTDIKGMSLAEIRDYMAAHFHEPLTIHHLAKLTGLSPNYFGEAFKKAYGQSVLDYITGLRIGQAKQMLCDTDLYLRDIARRVGYSDEFYFSRKFKKEVGVSPSVYSRDCRRRVAAVSPEATGNLLALGIVPVAAPLDPKWSPYYYYFYESRIKVHLSSSNLEHEDNLRKLLSAKPDYLVVHSALPEPVISRIMNSGIQLISVKAEHWRGQMRETAAGLEQSASCEDWIRSYDIRALEARKSLNRAVGDDIFVTLRVSGDEIYLYSNRGTRDVLYQDLGLHVHSKMRGRCNEPITLEQLSGINPDRLLMLICPDAVTRMFWLSLQNREEWKRLEAVKRGHVYLIPSNPWFEYSATAVNRMLEEMLLMLTGKSPNPSPVPVHGVPSAIHL
ncbi:helix-turn-helix domain-containing protein [Paenibacillus tuaregi]|uniref:helix-turn-helix domain-containing protein n=1 Tax=Paenibacillus tuaregi TaxID=1816681 RepID=UPI0008399E78|nr:helix-turn-helix domain-containing protein [Paenibacillus tuaregi]